MTNNPFESPYNTKDMKSDAKSVKEFHTQDDVDSATKAHHHTLGDGIFQAAPGAYTKATLNSLLATVADLQAQITANSVKPGTIMGFGGNVIPSGWVLCDGVAVSRTSPTYSGLYASIGTTWGIGDGSTTFNLPDLRGRVLVGQHTGQTEFDTLGETGGARTHILGISEIPAHNHEVPTDFGPATMSHMSGATGRVAQTGTGAAGAANPIPLTSNVGGGGAHNNLQPYATGKYMIKL